MNSRSYSAFIRESRFARHSLFFIGVSMTSCFCTSITLYNSAFFSLAQSTCSKSLAACSAFLISADYYCFPELSTTSHALLPSANCASLNSTFPSSNTAASILNTAASSFSEKPIFYSESRTCFIMLASSILATFQHPLSRSSANLLKRLLF